jgi:D-alanine-D-alanine ligase
MVPSKVGVIMGGNSAERQVSLRSGGSVVQALKLLGYDVAAIVMDDLIDLGRRLKAGDVDVAFLALHGRYGEDGCVQGMLEMMGIPYTGSGVLSSALCMDKVKSKEMFRLHNVPTPPYYSVDSDWIGSLDEQHAAFGFPVVVKPRREGSSIGVTKVTSRGELHDAVAQAASYDGGALVERFIKGTEVAVGLLDGRVLGAIEVVPGGPTGMYDYRAKYETDTTQYFMPARLDGPRYQGVLNLAERAARALDCRGAVRVDLIVTEGQNEYVLEVNSLPGLTHTSLLPKIAEAAGYDFPSLCDAILRSARLELSSPVRQRSAPPASSPVASEPVPEVLAQLAG